MDGRERCLGRMSVVISVLPRHEGDPIHRMKTTIVAGSDAARNAVVFRRDDGLRTMPPNHLAAVSSHNNQITVAMARAGEVSVFVGGGMGWRGLLEQG